MNPRILGLVTARGGSKRLPGKNLLPLGGRTLLEWTIEAAKKSGVLSSILLSTDDPAIAEVGRRAGALVPWLRPANLATDTAGSADVALHALNWYEAEHGSIDGLMLLQPTSPFRKHSTIRQAAEKFAQSEGRTVVSLSPASVHPAWCFSLKGEKLEPFLGWEAVRLPPQQLPAAYMLNGAVYLVRPDTLRNEGRFVTEDAIPLIMDDPIEGIDIDTSFDMALAQSLVMGPPTASFGANTRLRSE